MFIKKTFVNSCFSSLQDTQIQVTVAAGVSFVLSFDSNRISTSQEFLGVNCLPTGKSMVLQGVGYQILLPFPVLSVLCATLLCKNCVTL